MAKRIQLILNQDVPKLGKIGDVVDVAPGYARNYLVPKNIALRSTPGLLRQAEVRKEKERQRLLELKKVAETQKATLEKVASFTITKQVGENESIFGTVTAPELVTLIKDVTGLEVDRRDVEIPDINKLGTYPVEIKLHPEVTATINVLVAA
jgi:large subunit ribosomal protein L9